ncbi:MAG: signal peptidase I [Gammaproteobacteria bacterium]
MRFDFAAILVLATAISGLIWALDAFLFAKKRGLIDSNGEKKEPLVVEYAKAFFPILLLVLVLRSFLVEPFRIPSGSMKPTLLVGDFILVNKYAYGVRLPVSNTKIVDVGSPQRGEVVVFRFPRDHRLDYIKRVIGLPGDRVTYLNKQLFINGVPVGQVSLGMADFEGLKEGELREEYLDNATHHILVERLQRSPTVDVVVPEGHYFVMGDNRDHSNDSRMWGFVPEKNLVGRAFYIWMSLPSLASLPRWDRLGNGIK